MTLCAAHLADLKAALTERGLGTMFRADDDGEPSLIIQATGRETQANYNPLTSANAMIRKAALKVGGPYLIANKPDGTQYCPICEGLRVCRDQGWEEKIILGWVVKAADAVAQYVSTLPSE